MSLKDAGLTNPIPPAAVGEEEPVEQAFKYMCDGVRITHRRLQKLAYHWPLLALSLFQCEHRN